MVFETYCVFHWRTKENKFDFFLKKTFELSASAAIEEPQTYFETIGGYISSMGHLFSKLFHRHDGHGHQRKSNKVTEHDKAVLDLKNQRDKLKQYQKRVLYFCILK